MASSWRTITLVEIAATDAAMSDEARVLPRCILLVWGNQRWL
ncbi:MAG: hypothetical protein ACM3PE_10010 [Deltaproteobacteria bacterium]